ncbi:MAG: alginate export family protein [Nitrospirae bacterium]|nr:alginate export family protein [Nitrospirota bacterium]MCL5237084.1 alginate export family protein [Nitrospirota bacterium]
MNMIHKFFAPLVLGIFLFAPFDQTEAAGGDGKERPSLPSGQEDTRDYIQKLEKRVSDLESVIKTLLEGKKPEVSVSAPKPAPATAGGDEWGEPAAGAESVKGRDEEARRRLTEVETWKRRLEAKAAKEAEEESDRVKLDFSGKYKVRFNSRNNLNLNNPSQFWQFDNSAFFDQRVQLKLDAQYGPLSSVILFDKGNFVFDWKEDSQGTLERWGEFFTVTSTLLRELYVQYTGNFVVKAGRQNMMLGNGGIVLEGPVDSLKITYPFGKTNIGVVSGSLAYIANAGGFANYNGITYPPGVGNRSSSLLGAANKLDAFLLSFDIRPGRDLVISPYIFKVVDRGRFGNPDLNLDKDYNPNTTPRDGGFEPLWIGTALSGKSGRLSYTGDFVYLTGSYTKERDYKAYALMLRGDYSLQKLVPLRNPSVGLELGRGSGNTAEEKISGTGDAKDFTGLFLCKDRRKFGNIFSQDLRAGYFLADSNLANVTFIRAITSFEPVRMLKTTAALAKLWTTESVYKGRGPVRDWSVGASTTTEKTRDIGWELDLNLDFPIYKRLRGFTEMGYFIPGDVYRQANGQRADPASEFVLGAEFEF